MKPKLNRVKVTFSTEDELARFLSLCAAMKLSQSDVIRKALSLAFSLDLPILWRQPESEIEPQSKARRESRRKKKE